MKEEKAASGWGGKRPGAGRPSKSKFTSEDWALILMLIMAEISRLKQSSPKKEPDRERRIEALQDLLQRTEAKAVKEHLKKLERRKKV